MAPVSETNAQWIALVVLCMGAVLIVTDAWVVTVALPRIADDLDFSQTSLAWVVNAYILAFGGFLLLGGRLGDLYGARRLFLGGVAAFTLASLACGLATSRTALICARAAQGLGGAVIDATSLALVMTMFTRMRERTKAIGIFGFVSSVGGTLGIVVGGGVISALNWHWLFLINFPIGVIVYLSSLYLIPASVDASTGTQATRMSSLPLVPRGLFKSRALLVANIAAIFWAASQNSWAFICTLYLQRVAGNSAMQVAAAFLPTSLLMAAVSIGVSGILVERFGTRIPMVTGLLLGALGIAMFTAAPLHAHALTDVLPGMALIGIGAGLGVNTLFLAAMQDVEPANTGVASGLINTSNMIGGAVGLAIVAGIAESRTRAALVSGAEHLLALNSGYHVAFIVCAAFACLAAALGSLFMPREPRFRPPAAHSACE